MFDAKHQLRFFGLVQALALNGQIGRSVPDGIFDRYWNL